MKKKITSEDIKKAMQNFNGSYTHLGTARADGASMNGSVCAAGFGASALGRAQARAVYFKDQKQREKMRERREKLKRDKPKVKSPATEKQLNYLNHLGVNFKKNISKWEARNLISKILRVKKESEKNFLK
jgi:hypothetical protein